MRNRHAFGVCALALALAAADSAAQTGPNHGAVPVVHSVRATSAIVVDGALTDEVWLRAVPVTSFTQRDPEEGKPVSEATELRIAYDEAALYVGVRLLDREPARIARQLARRDQNAEADSFSLFLDAAPRPRHRRHVLGQCRGRPAGRDDLQRFVDRRLVGCGVGVRREDRRHRLGRRDADSLLAAAVFPCGAADVRDQRDALHPAQEGGSLAGPRAEDRERPGFADGTSRRPRRRRAAADRRAAARTSSAAPSMSSRRPAIRSTTAHGRSPAPASI